jgi:DNA-binding CsgD family transcriptional regulator
VVHRREDRAIPYALGREVAAGIPGAALSPVDGRAHFPWAGDGGSVIRALRATPAGDGAARPEPTGGAAAAAGADDLLSPREREVLALVARGHSDRAIAEQLIVSPHTVHRHVANIRAKLGAGSRAAAVAEAARLGLL